MVLDAATVAVAAFFVALYRLHFDPSAFAGALWNGREINGHSVWIQVALMLEFTLVLIITSRRFHLYEPMRLRGFLNEQRLSLYACFLAGLILSGTLYWIRAQDVNRGFVFITIMVVAVALGVRRFIYRFLRYRQFRRGVGTRNVLIAGAGPEALALRHHIESIPTLGYTFKGFIEVPGVDGFYAAPQEDIVGTLGTLFDQTRKYFIDEVFFTSHCHREVVQDVVEQARKQGLGLRVIADFYDGLDWTRPAEYIGQFPTLPLHPGELTRISQMMKRAFDIVFSSMALLLLLPVFGILAILIKMDSPGPVFYAPERIGKKGRPFHCIKFRTMARDAEQRRAALMHMNERDGVLFKITNDPRITRLGRFLRKYSLDELPQFWNVLRGDMSVVGPRPPLPCEVQEYKLGHLRRLDVAPGITGLWQVQGRRDPSFANYVSLDVFYVDNWTFWLDFKIVVRTIGVVLAGTGS